MKQHTPVVNTISFNANCGVSSVLLMIEQAVGDISETQGTADSLVATGIFWFSIVLKKSTTA